MHAQRTTGRESEKMLNQLNCDLSIIKYHRDGEPIKWIVAKQMTTTSVSNRETDKECALKKALKAEELREKEHGTNTVQFVE